MFAYMGRQPVYAKDLTHCGNFILHRENVTRVSKRFEDEDAALQCVFTNAIALFDFDKLTEGLPAHILFTREMLFWNMPFIADPKRIVVEISADTSVDEKLTDKLTELKIAGYKLAISGYNMRNGTVKLNKILNYFDMVYVDVHQNSRLQLTELIGKIRQNSAAKVLGEQIDTQADFDKVQGLNISIYQGLLFGKPSILKEEVNLANTPYGQVYNEASKPSASLDTCCKIITGSRVLTQMLLQTFPTVREQKNIPSDVKATIMAMGMGPLRKWSCLLLLKQLNESDTLKLSREAYRRGTLMERLLEESTSKGSAETGFYYGAFSIMDKITDTPLTSILGQLRIESEARSSLLGKEKNVFDTFLNYILRWEEPDKPPQDPAVKVSLTERRLAEAYKRSVLDTETAFYVFNPFSSKGSRR